jgi:hypothetical protein
VSSLLGAAIFLELVVIALKLGEIIELLREKNASKL